MTVGMRRVRERRGDSQNTAHGNEALVTTTAGLYRYYFFLAREAGESAGEELSSEQGLWRGSRSSDSPELKCPSVVAEAGAWRVVTVTTVDTLSFRVLRALGEGLCSFPYF